MHKSPRRRQLFSALLIVLGGVFLLFAPENAWIGPVLIVAGIAIELAAFWLARSSGDGK